MIGEIAAGVLLGPSLLGWIAPDASGFLFPLTSMPTLQLLSQIGVLLSLSFSWGRGRAVASIGPMARSS